MKEDIKGNWISFNDITPYEVISKSKPEYKYLVSSTLHISIGLGIRRLHYITHVKPYHKTYNMCIADLIFPRKYYTTATTKFSNSKNEHYHVPHYTRSKL